MQFVNLIVLSLVGLAYMVEIVHGYVGFNNTNICCDGVLGSLKQICCGKGKVYDPSEKLCCNNVLMPSGKATTHGCCYDKKTAKPSSFELKTHVCCDGIVTKKTNSNKNYGCCISKIFLLDKSFCCNGTVLPKMENTDCCGDKLPFNPTKHLCVWTIDPETNVGNVALEEIKDGRSGVCTNPSDNKQIMYDPKKEACCYDVYGQRTTVESNKKGYQQAACCYPMPPADIKSEDATRVKPEVYDFSSELCCEGKVVNVPKNLRDPKLGARCCGKKVIANNQTCCGGKIESATGVCCDDKFFKGAQLCCNNKGIKEPASFDAVCCVSPTAQTVFHTTTEVCCGGKVFKKKPSTLACCDAIPELYDSLTHTCAQGGKISPKTQAEVTELRGILDSCGTTFPLVQPMVYY